MISAETLRRIAALKLPAEALSEVLSIIADMQASDDARKEKDRNRKRNVRGKSEECPRDDDGKSEDAKIAYKDNHASAPVISNGSSLRSEPCLDKPLPSEGPLSPDPDDLGDPTAPAAPEDPDEPDEPAKKRKPIDILSECLSRQTAADIVEHRRKLRKPLTARAAELTAKALVECGDPESGAAMWIALGWQGFRVDWFRNELARSKARASPDPPRKRLHPTERMALGITNDAEEDAYFRSFETPEPQHERSDPPAYDGPTIDLDAADFGEPGAFDKDFRDEKPHRGNQPHETADLWGPRTNRGGSC